MSEDKEKEMEAEIKELKGEVTEIKELVKEILVHFKSDPSLGHVGYSEQIKINCKEIAKLKIDKKILLGVGGVVGGVLSGLWWVFSKLKSIG